MKNIIEMFCLSEREGRKKKNHFTIIIIITRYYNGIMNYLVCWSLREVLKNQKINKICK